MEKITLKVIPKKNGVMVNEKYLPSRIFSTNSWRMKFEQLINEAAKLNGIQKTFAVKGNTPQEVFKSAKSQVTMLNLVSEMKEVYNG